MRVVIEIKKKNGRDTSNMDDAIRLSSPDRKSTRLWDTLTQIAMLRRHLR